ncbi:MAG: CBS domain-containing protein [Magnetococcales bacterium]|nr:CBS domain-containing protein [Magnetococcales bacterium]
MEAREIMSQNVISVPPDMPVLELAQLLTEKGIRGVPVLDGDILLGVVTEGDLIDRVKKIHLPTMITLLDAVIPISGEHQYQEDLRKASARTAADLMTSELVVILESTSLSELATAFSEEHISLLPVMRGELVVGVVSKSDVIRGMIEENKS